MVTKTFSSVKHGFDPHIYFQAIPPERVRQIHLAVHETQDGYLIDTHDHPVCEVFWQLYGDTLRHCGSVPAMIERDDNIPELKLTPFQSRHQVLARAHQL